MEKTCQRNETTAVLRKHRLRAVCRMQMVARSSAGQGRRPCGRTSADVPGKARPKLYDERLAGIGKTRREGFGIPVGDRPINYLWGYPKVIGRHYLGKP